MKKIALFIPDFGGGGAERIMLRLAGFFLKKGYIVDFVVVRKLGPLQYLLPQKANVIVLNSRRTAFSLPKLIKYLRKERPFAILSTLHTANWIAALAKMLSFNDTKSVIRVATYLSRKKHNSVSLDYHLNKLFYLVASRIAFSIIGISGGVANDLVQNIGLRAKNIRTIYNPAYSDDISLLANESLNHPWFDDKGIVVVGVGNLTLTKDFNTLLKAFYLVRQKIKAKLIILGEGPERENLVKTARQLKLENDVMLPGFVKNPYSYMERASVFVCSSRYEGFANVIVESLAVNTPVVSTDCQSGPREILENGKWGKLVPVGNAELLSNAIIETLREEKTIDLRQRAKQFDLEIIGNQYLMAMGVDKI